MARGWVRHLVVTASAVLAFVPASAVAAPAPQPIVGALHEHSAYSDGWPGTRPAGYYASGARHGLGFMGGSEHSDNLGIPAVLSEGCAGPAAPQCVLADQVNPADSFRKWDATQEQADAAMKANPGFAAFRGFEWSSQRFGHINVFFSRNWTNAYADGGNADMGNFWRWFTRPPSLGGGGDGLATFNHPGAKRVDSVPGLNWDDFEYVPAADERMVGLEVFNDRDEFGSRGGPYPQGSYVHALDKGWHVGAVGTEDLGHNKPPADDWGGPGNPKTVVLAPESTPAAIRAAMLARHMYAVGPGEQALRLTFTADGQQMGSRLQRPVGAPVRLRATVNDPTLALEAVTSRGRVVSRGTGALSLTRRAEPDERWYFLRVRRGDRVVGYSSPVWVEAEAGARAGSWLAGDMHAHTCFSHDAYCPGDPPEKAETFYSSGGSVAARFGEASLKGLDYLTISDHDDLRAQRDPDFGGFGVTGVPAYETSLKGGHAQMLGAARSYDKGDGSGIATSALADALRADGGLFQANHPSYRSGTEFNGCDTAEIANWERNPLHWKYGYSVRPDSIEVFNATTLIPPSQLYWECWLQRGVRVGITGGSDSHGANQANLGMPTTWVFSRTRRAADVLAGVRAGRTTISRQAPAQGGTRLLLEADRDGDGSYESGIGDEVPAGTPMRARAEGLPGAGLVRIRANGRTLIDAAQLQPGGEVKFRAPAPGWTYGSLYLQDGTRAVDPGCRPPLSGESPVDACSADLAMAALTSAVWIGRSSGSVSDEPGRTVPQSTREEPDGQAPLAAGAQSNGSARLPNVRAAARGKKLRSLKLRVLRRAASRLRLVARWSGDANRFDVQIRRAGGRWRTVRRATRARSLGFTTRSVRYAARVRTHPLDAIPGPWRFARVAR